MIESKPRAILFRVGGLGDLLVALPAIALVRRVLPAYRLTLAGRAEYASLLARAGVIDEAISFEDPKVTALFTYERGITLFDGVAHVMGWWNTDVDWPDTAWRGSRGIGRTSFVTYDPVSCQPLSRFFFDRTRGQFGAEAAKRTGAGAGATGVRPASSEDLSDQGRLFDECARLILPRALIEKALADLGLRPLAPGERRLVVHPGSGGRAKRWPLANFLDVVRQAAARGFPGILVTGEAEGDLESSLRSVALPAGWTSVSRLPAETLAGLLASATHYIGNDSGPTHLAAACGARVLAFFRDENLPAWRPFGRTRVLGAPAVDRIPLSAALPAVDDLLAS